MNSVLNITIRVAADQARAAIKSVNDQLKTMGAAGSSSSMAGGVDSSTKAITGLSRAMSSSGLVDFGKNLQWTGRQMEMNFTLPIVAGAASIVHWQKANATAMADVQRVYGDATTTAAQMEEETGKLAKTFELLSDIYGVNQAEVINVGAAWASTGKTGAELAGYVKQTMETMVVGGQSAEEATNGLITMTETFHLSATQLHDTMMILNSVENATAIKTQDLLDVFQRAGGSAVTAGVGVRQLAAMAAALVPNAANASQAGNSLRTMLTRIMAPTGQASELFKAMGINLAEFNKLSGTERLQTMASHFEDLSDAQKTVVAQAAAGTFQISRFDVLMAAMADTQKNGIDANNGYAQALKATGDQAQMAAVYQRELSIALGSDPQKYNQLTNILKNNLTTAFQGLLPTLIIFVGYLAKASQWFVQLSPQTQQFALIALGLLAAIGPITRYMGAWITLFGLAGNVLGTVGKIGAGTIDVLSKIAGAAWKAAAGRIGAEQAVAAAFAASAAEEAAAAAAAGGAVSTSAGMTAIAQMSSAGASAAAWVASAEGTVYAWERGTAIMGELAAGTAVAETAAAAESAAAWKLAAIETSVASSGSAAATTSVWARIGGFFTGLWGGIARGAGIAWGAITGLAGGAVRAIAVAGAAIASAFGPAEIAAIVAAVVLVISGVLFAIHKLFDGGIKGFVQATMDAFGKLPAFIGQVFQSVIRVISSMMQTVIHWLSYLNPWQRHSPSLVDNVTSGVTEILSQYSRLTSIGGMLQGSYGALKNFSNATAGAADSMANQKIRSQRDAVTDTVPTAGPAFDALVGSIQDLRPQLRAIGDEYARQSDIVATYSDALDVAKASLEAQQDALTGLKRSADAAADSLSNAKDQLSQLTDNTQLAGYGAMQDAIFANKMAQDQLNLSILQMGTNADDALKEAQDQVAKLQGDIESLQGRATDLRLNGAGSEITGPIQAQVDAMRQAQGDIQSSIDNSPLKAMQDQLAELQNQGQQLDLQNALQFDPLNRQIEAVTKSMTEMPFDQLLAQTQAAKTNVDNLSAAYDTANAAVKTQQLVVDSAQNSVDAAQKAYDDQNDTLKSLSDAYSAVSDQIQNAEAAINDFSSAAEQAKAKQGSSAMDTFNAGAGADFPDVTGAAGNFDQGSLDDMNKQLQQQVDDMLKNIKFDPLKPIKEGWKKAWGWIKSNGGDAIDAVQTGIGGAVGWIERNFSLEGIKNTWKTVWGSLGDTVSSIWNGTVQPILQGAADWLTSVFGPTFTWLNDNIIQPVWTAIQTAISAAWTVIQPIWQAVVDFVNNYIVPVLQLLGAIVEIVFVAIGLLIVGAWNNVIKPVFDALWNFIRHDLGDVFNWLWNNVVKPVFDGISGVISAAWNGVIKPILQGVWDFITNVVGPVFHWLFDNAVKPVFDGISTAIGFAWDKGIHPVLDAIGGFIKNTLGPIFSDLWHNVVEPVWSGITKSISSAWNGITGAIRSGVNFAIQAFNKLAGFVNTIGDKLHIGIHVDSMPEVGAPPALAAGGVIPSAPASGGLFKDVRAIVGEGSNLYPEFVIPTDPRYRDRAMALLKQANIRMLAFGGVVGSAKNAVSSTANAIGDAASAANDFIDSTTGKVKKASVDAILNPIIGEINGLLKNIQIPLVSGMVNSIVTDVKNWIGGAEAFNGAIIKGTASGSIIRAGERNQTEAIIPLPNGMKDFGKSTENHFHGDLVFPNIKNGDDAETFINNLERLGAS